MSDKKTRLTPRVWYTVAFVSIFAAIIYIALFVRDKFIRPYGGDILVTVLICCFGRIFFPSKIKLLPVYVFLFAVAVEIGQYFELVDLIGLGGIPLFRIALGTSFSPHDIICYGAGCVLFWVGEKIIRK